MVDWKEFKAALGESAKHFSDEEIQALNVKAHNLAEFLYQLWVSDLMKEEEEKLASIKAHSRVNIH